MTFIIMQTLKMKSKINSGLIRFKAHRCAHLREWHINHNMSSLDNIKRLRSETTYILYRSHAYACTKRSLWRAVEHPYQISSTRMSADRGWNIKGTEGGAARTRMASPSRSLFYCSSRTITFNLILLKRQLLARTSEYR